MTNGDKIRQIDKKYIVTDVQQLRQKMRGNRNITLYVPKRITIWLEDGDLQQLKNRNIKLKTLED